MKKRKFNILLNIAVLCMCVCAIAIGVYSAKTASLNVSGTIGFEAHNCNVNISAYMYGHSLTADGTPVAKPTSDSEKQYLVYGTSNTKATESAPLVINGGSESLSFNINTDSTYKGVYFSDMGTTGDVEPIVIMLTITNLSDFTILFDDNSQDGEEYIVTCSNNLNVLYNKNDSVTIRYELYPALDSNGNFKNITNTASVQLNMNFSKLNTNISKNGYTYDTSNKSITGVPENTNNADIIVIPSQFNDLENVQFENLAGDTSSSEMPNITHISEYKKVVILKGIKTIGDYIFNRDDKLISVALPNTLETIGSDAFRDAKNLSSIYLPCTIKGIISYGFADCYNLKSITFEGGEESLSINSLSFTSTKIFSLYLPKNLSDITDNSFHGSKNLRFIKVDENNAKYTDGGCNAIIEKSTNKIFLASRNTIY